MRKIIPFIFLCVFLSNTSWAKTNTDTLKKTELELLKIKQENVEAKKVAKALKQEIVSIKKSTYTLVKRTQEYEEQLLLLKDNIDALNTKLTQTKKKLNNATADLAGIISAMQRVSKNPENALLLYPGTPEQAIKSTALLKSILPQINNKKLFIQKNLAELELISNDLLSQEKLYQSKSAKLNIAQKDLEVKLKRKKILQSKTLKKSKNLQNTAKNLTSKIKTIKKFLSKIAKEEKRQKSEIHLTKPATIKRFPTNGKIQTPVVGRITKHFNRRYESGKKNTGITISTRKNANVFAPFDGYVSYAGHFGTLGKVIIISHEGGYNSVLIGLKENYINTGVWVLTGEPLGKMGVLKNHLHIEIRYGQKPLNPLRWLQKSKIKG